MRMLFKSAIASLMLMPLSAAADAPEGVIGPSIITHMTQQDVVDVLQKQGYRAVIEKGKTNYVVAGMAGYNVIVWMYNCTAADCESIQLMLFGKDEKVTPSVANAWNANWRYTKLYLDKEGYYNFVQDINFREGVTQRHIQAMIADFEDAVVRLKKSN